ncbi:MAG: hypothetical protein ACJ71T_10490 [Actinomycetales bacterium]
MSDSEAADDQDVERRATDDRRSADRRQLIDLTRIEKGLPERRAFQDRRQSADPASDDETEVSGG